jgi:hypothetical protein
VTDTEMGTRYESGRMGSAGRTWKQHLECHMLTLLSDHINASVDDVREKAGWALNHCLQRATAAQTTRQERVVAPHDSQR